MTDTKTGREDVKRRVDCSVLQISSDAGTGNENFIISRQPDSGNRADELRKGGIDSAVGIVFEKSAVGADQKFPVRKHLQRSKGSADKGKFDIRRSIRI